MIIGNMKRKAEIDTIMKSMIPLLLLSMIFFGCTKTIYQPVRSEKFEADSLIITKDTLSENFRSILNELKRTVSITDSVIIHDSVVMVVDELGAVISKESYHGRDRNLSKDKSEIRLMAKYDSIFNAQRNELIAIHQRLEQSTKPIERKLGKWEQLKQDVGGIALGLITAILAFAVVWLIKRFKRYRCNHI